MIKTIVLIVVIIFCIYLYLKNHYKYKLYTKDGIVLDKLDYTDTTIVKSNIIKPPLTENEITFSLWLYLKEFYYNFSYWKHIMHKGTNIENKTLDYKNWHNIENEIPEQSIGIWMHPNINNIRIAMTTENYNLEYCDIENIKQQELTHLVFILDNKTLHIYKNSKLIITNVFKNKPVFNVKSLYFNYQKTFNGSIYNFMYLPKKIDYKDIPLLYKNKPTIEKYKNYEYRQLFKDKLIINKNKTFISNLKLPPSHKGVKFTYLFWIFIRNIPENALWNSSHKYKKTIIKRNGSPNINYIPKNNILNFEISYKDNFFETSMFNINIENIKLQKWMHVSLVLDNRKVNIYINGNLEKTTIVPNIPFIYNKNLYIGEDNNNFFGYLYNGVYYNTSLKHDKIISLVDKQKNSLPEI